MAATKRVFEFTDARREALRKARKSGGNAKLTEAMVRRVRDADAAGVRPVDLAERYNVERTRIWYIVTRRNWAHVE